MTLPLGGPSPSPLAAPSAACGRHVPGGRDRLANSFNRTQSGLVERRLRRRRRARRRRSASTAFATACRAAGGERAFLEGRRRELRGRAELTAAAGPLANVRAEGTAQWYTHDEVEQGAWSAPPSTSAPRPQPDGATRLGRFDGAVGVQGLFRQYAASGEEALTPAANTTNGGLFVYQELPLTGRPRTAPTAPTTTCRACASSSAAASTRSASPAAPAT